MDPYEQLIYDRFAACIKEWVAGGATDIYALGMSIDTACSADAARLEVTMQSWVSFVYNTETNYRSCIAGASSEQEARWCSGSWIWPAAGATPTNVPRSFEYGTDPPADELALRDAWCAAHGLVPTSFDGGGRPEYDGLLDSLTHRACRTVAQAIHHDGTIRRALGHDAPILIEEHDNRLVNAASTYTANPPDLADDLIDYLVRGYGHRQR